MQASDEHVDPKFREFDLACARRVREIMAAADTGTSGGITAAISILVAEMRDIIDIFGMSEANFAFSRAFAILKDATFALSALNSKEPA